MEGDIQCYGVCVGSSIMNLELYGRFSRVSVNKGKAKGGIGIRKVEKGDGMLNFCISLFELLYQNIRDWVAQKNRNLFLTILETGKFKV